MSPEFHQRVRNLFEEALREPEPHRRRYVLDRCGTDTTLLRAVLELLDAHDVADSFLIQPAAPPAQRIGRYQLIRQLGSGGMGVVYEALDPLIERNLAVKLIPLKSLASTLDKEHTWKQLLTEARSAGLLSHPGIVIVYDVGQESDVAFIAMELVEGPSLQQMLDQNKKMAGPADLDLLRQTAEALDYAHQNGVLHRDIKPANLMVHRGATLKIADFGLAKITSNAGQTRTQVVMGTPAYMSPERIAMQPLDGRCDQFSLAVIAFQMLTGIKPFEGSSVPEVLYRITSRERPSACDLEPDLPFAVDDVLYRGLAIRPEDRYATCAAFTTALQDALLVHPRSTTVKPAAPSKPPVQPQPPAPSRPPTASRPPAPSNPPLAHTQPAVTAPSLPPSKSVPLTPPATPAAAPPVRPNPPIAPPIAVPVVHAQRPVAPAPPSIPVVIPPNQPRGWPRILLAVLLAASAMTLGVLAVRKFLPPPSDGVSVTPVLPPVGQEPASAAPTIVRFTVEPDTIEPGGSAQLAWDVAGSTEVEIVPSVGPVAASGSATVSPSSPMNYQLTARGPGGQQAKASVMVDVREKTSAVVSKEPSATKPANKPTPTPVMHPEGPAVQLPPQPPTPAPQEPAPAPTDNASRARQLYQQAAEAKRAAQPAKALELFRAAAELGDFRAMVELGKMYRAGEGVAAEIHESAKWFRKAADGGYTPAMVLVGGLYFEGKAYPKDLPEAVKWFRKAAEANDPLGMDELGLMYANGFGVTKDEKQAFFWFEKAATAGNNLGLFHLARCYERGIGVNKDMALAAGYYEKAAAAGNADARARLAKLGESNAAAVNLAGNQQWTDTGSALKPGDAVTVTASGSLILPPALHAPAMTPAGSAVGCKEAAQLYGSSPGSPAPHLNCWSLIGRVGPSGPIFAVGTSKSFHASTAGELYLGINHENVQQNSGGWKAVVKVGK